MFVYLFCVRVCEDMCAAKIVLYLIYAFPHSPLNVRTYRFLASLGSLIRLSVNHILFDLQLSEQHRSLFILCRSLLLDFQVVNKKVRFISLPKPYRFSEII